MRFSKRYGYKEIREKLQIETMNKSLKTELWNLFRITYFKERRIRHLTGYNSYKENFLNLVKRLWIRLFEKDLDEIYLETRTYSSLGNQCVRTYNILKKKFFNMEWYEVYDFLECVTQIYNDNQINNQFRKYCNSVLKRHKSGYRFVNEKIIPITDEIEIKEIKEVFESGDKFLPIQKYMDKAIKSFSDKKNPDYVNAIKESIHAIEAMCGLILKDLGKGEVTLGKALNKLVKNGIDIHPKLLESFQHLYWYTSDSQIRHGKLDESNIDIEETKFMLVTCSAFLNYLKVKMDKAKIDVNET